MEIPDPNLNISKTEIIETSKEYISKFNKERNELLYHMFVPNSYPIYEENNAEFSNYDINPFCYSKDEIMKNIDNFVEKNF